MKTLFGTTATWLWGLVAFVACGPPPAATQAPAVCPQDVKECPDGMTVGRSGPDCEFDPCREPMKEREGLSPDPAPEGPDGDVNPKPMGTFNPSEPPPG